MKKSAIVFAIVLCATVMVSAQTKSIFSDSPGVSSSIFSSPRVSNYNTSVKSSDSYLSNQQYRSADRITEVNTTRTSLGNNSYISGTDVFCNGSRRSSSRTISNDFGGSRMTTTTYFNNNGSVKSSRTRTRNIGW